MFERFLTPGRKDLPDVDLDFDSDRRDEVVAYLRGKYGDDRVAYISTRIELGGRGTLRDLGRVMEIPEAEIAPVASQITSATAEEDQSEDALGDIFKGTEVGKAFAARYSDVADVAGRLEGNLRSVGLHAAGVVISSRPVAEVAPVETLARKGGPRVRAVAFDMKGTEAAGLVKLDVLGIRTLTMISRACDIAGIKSDEIPLDDPEALAGFTDQRFVGIFQFDSPSARRATRGFTFSRFADVAVLNALNRPGPLKSGLAREYVARAATGEVPSLHPIYDEVMADTFGVPVYQEQVVTLVRRMCGYSPEAADAYRKKVAKKIGLADERDPFLSGAIANGVPLDVAEGLFDSLAGFASYAFNRSHAYCYAAIAVWSMFLKVHHPEAFFAAALATEDEPEKQLRFAADARRCGIRVAPPEINASGGRFTLTHDADGPVIVGSVADLKGIGLGVANAIANRRPYTSLADLYKRTAGGGVRVTAATFEILARATALRSLIPNTRFAVENARVLWAALKKGIDVRLDDLDRVPDFDPESRAVVAGEVYPLFVDLEGVSAFESVERRVMDASRRPLSLLGDVDLDVPGFHAVVARLAKIKLFPGDDGKNTARILLSSSDGYELAVRVDSDVLDSSAVVLSTVGRSVIVMLGVSGQGRVRAEAIFDAAIATAGGKDPVGDWMVDPKPTKPSNPYRAVARIADGSAATIEGMVIRVDRRTDRSGGRMRVVGILGSRGYVRVYVFASRIGRPDVKGLARGAMVRVQVEKLSGDGIALGDKSVEVL
jgi:hypothetical protein